MDTSPPTKRKRPSNNENSEDNSFSKRTKRGEDAGTHEEMLGPREIELDGYVNYPDFGTDEVYATTEGSGVGVVSHRDFRISQVSHCAQQFSA